MSTTTSQSDRPLQIAILVYQGVTALDVVGPSEVLTRLPNVDVRFVGKDIGPVTTESSPLLLAATHSLDETPQPDIILVPGGATTPSQMVDDEILAWLRTAHQTSRWTTSVCTGALILGAAGLLKGLPATTHWYKLNVLKIMGAKPQPEERIVRSGKIATAAGVSAGIDLALWLAGELAGAEEAQAIQLTIEYDPQPPFKTGHFSTSPASIQRLARQKMDDRMSSEQKHLVPKIAWRRFIDFIKTGK